MTVSISTGIDSKGGSENVESCTDDGFEKIGGCTKGESKKVRLGGCTKKVEGCTDGGFEKVGGSAKGEFENVGSCTEKVGGCTDGRSKKTGGCTDDGRR